MENENNLAAPLAGTSNANEDENTGDESDGLLNPVQRQLLEYRLR